MCPVDDLLGKLSIIGCLPWIASIVERIANERLEAMFEENQLDAIFLTRACSDRDPIWLASPAK
jgi:hypothetical protein